MAEHKNSPLKILKPDSRKIQTPRAPSPKRINYDEDDEIKSRGYKPISYVLNLKKEIKYVKAYNNKGQKIYIEIDVTTYTHQAQGDILDIITQDGRKHLLEATGGIECGIVSESEDGIYFVDKNKQLWANKKFGHEMIFPLIKLSLLRQFSEKMLDIQNKARKNINLYNVNYMRKNFDDLTKSVSEYYTKMNYISDTKNKVVQKLNTTIDELHAYQTSWQNDVTKNLDEADTYHLLVYNLELRYQLLSDIKTVIDKMCKFTERVDQEIGVLDDLIKTLNDKFSDLDKTHDKRE